MTTQPENKIADPLDIKAESKTDYVSKGWMNYHQGHYENAVDDFWIAVDKDPEDLNSLYALALSLSALGKTDEAKKLFVQIIERVKNVENIAFSNILTHLSNSQLNKIEKGSW